jgi:galactokinase/mevalonate kinase-like predicted kinase
VLIGRSPVRISFGGGGTDLPSYYEQFGGAVLSVAINKYFYTVVGKRTDGRVQVISSDLRLFENWRDVTASSRTLIVIFLWISSLLLKSLPARALVLRPVSA